MNEVPVGTACGTQASDAELMARLDATLAEYKGKPGALIPVLQIAQGIFGFLPERVLKHVALSLGKSYSEVAGVVGFYSFFSTVPRGKHLIRVCLGTACYVRGGKQLLETFKDELGIDVGGTTPDGLFSLEVARCFGACGLAPTVMIDEDVLQRVKPLKVRGILETYKSGGSPSGNGGAAHGAAQGKKNPGGKAARAGATGAAGRATGAAHGKKSPVGSGRGRAVKATAVKVAGSARKAKAPLGGKTVKGGR